MQSEDPFYRICPYCGNKFLTIHGNRKFCPTPKNYNDPYRDCKSTFNNLKAKVKRDKTKMLTKQQYENWVGLNQLYKKNKIIVSETDLRSEGIYCEAFIVSKTIKETGDEVKCYIEYGLIKINENQFKIIKHGLQL